MDADLCTSFMSISAGNQRHRTGLGRSFSQSHLQFHIRYQSSRWPNAGRGGHTALSFKQPNNSAILPPYLQFGACSERRGACTVVWHICRPFCWSRAVDDIVHPSPLIHVYTRKKRRVWNFCTQESLLLSGREEDPHHHNIDIPATHERSGGFQRDQRVFTQQKAATSNFVDARGICRMRVVQDTDFVAGPSSLLIPLPRHPQEASGCFPGRPFRGETVAPISYEIFSGCT